MYRGLEYKTEGKKAPYADQWSLTSPLLWIALGHAGVYAFEYDIELVVTNILGIYGEFNTHKGRACDLRSRNWSEEHILGFSKHMRKINFLGAYSARTKKQNIAVVEKDHIHLQVKYTSVKQIEFFKELFS